MQKSVFYFFVFFDGSFRVDKVMKALYNLLVCLLINLLAYLLI